MKGVREMKEAYEGLSELMDEETLKGWKEEEAEAMENRGEFMKIYEIKFNKGGCPYIELDSVTFDRKIKRSDLNVVISRSRLSTCSCVCFSIVD